MQHKLLVTEIRPLFVRRILSFDDKLFSLEDNLPRNLGMFLDGHNISLSLSPSHVSGNPYSRLFVDCVGAIKVTIRTQKNDESEAILCRRSCES